MGFKIGKLFKKLTPIIGSVLGTMVGGPAGGVIGGGLGGASTRGKGNKLSGALSGGLQGLAYQSLAPQLAGQFLPNSALAARMTGLNGPSLLNQLGFSGAPGMGGGLGLLGNFGQKGMLDPLLGGLRGSGLGGALSTVMGAMQRPGQPMNQQAMVNALMPPQHRPRSTDSVDETFEGNADSDELLRGEHSLGNHGMSPLEIFLENSGITKRTRRRADNEVKWQNPNESKWVNPNPVNYAKGGPVNTKFTGYIKVSNTGGQDDDVKRILPPDSYVWNGTDLSLLGDGFSDNGAKKLIDWENQLLNNRDTFTRSGVTKADGGHIIGVKARVSNGEFVMKPAAVRALGNGDVTVGVKVIDKMRKNLRKHKGVKSILPPRTKEFSYYMKGGA